MQRLATLPLTMTNRWGPIYQTYGWQATLAGDEPFAPVLMVDVDGVTLWAKAPPSVEFDLEVRLDPFPDDADVVRVSFSAPPGAYVAPVVVRLRDGIPVATPPQNQPATTARLLRPLSISSEPVLQFGLMTFAKSDIVVRRNHVWGLKPGFLDHFSSPFREVLEKGRHGSFPTAAAD